MDVSRFILCNLGIEFRFLEIGGYGDCLRDCDYSLRFAVYGVFGKTHADWKTHVQRDFFKAER